MGFFGKRENCRTEQVKDEKVSAKMEANKAAIAEYDTLESNINSLSVAVNDCYHGLSCCYENSVAGIKGIGNFSDLQNLTNEMKAQNENLTASLNAIRDARAALIAENTALQEQLYKTIEICE